MISSCKLWNFRDTLAPSLQSNYAPVSLNFPLFCFVFFDDFFVKELLILPLVVLLMSVTSGILLWCCSESSRKFEFEMEKEKPNFVYKRKCKIAKKNILKVGCCTAKQFPEKKKHLNFMEGKSLIMS